MGSALRDRLGPDARVFQGLERERGEAVGADAADHLHRGRRVRVGPRGGDRLVEALAAGHGTMAGTQHRFARARQGVDVEQEISVHRAEDDDHRKARLVTEVTEAGEDHGEALLVGRGDDLGVALRPARLNHGRGPGGGGGQEPVSKGKERV